MSLTAACRSEQPVPRPVEERGSSKRRSARAMSPAAETPYEGPVTDSDDDDFAALLAASEAASATRKQRLTAGEVVRGRVISVGATTAFVAVGGKAEAAIDVGEFRDSAT